MEELNERNALSLLAGRAGIRSGATARVLAGGVSNTVVLVEDDCRSIVLKQSLPRLRVSDVWLADRSRIVREWEVMRALEGHLPEGRLPDLLFLDESRFLYAMKAAPPGTVDWKSLLLAGELSPATARLAGTTLGLMARATWSRPEFRERFADSKAFYQLRTDPYYLTIARRHPGVAQQVEDWIEESRRRQVAMVHGDWSPKNLLVGPQGMACIDFECAHFGDPSYDAGFMLNHLILKSFRRPNLAADYLGLARIAFAWTIGMLPPDALDWYEAASVRHLAFLLLARVDGKSPAEYLRTQSVRDAVRQLALRLIDERPRTMRAVLGRAMAALAQYSRSTTRRP